MHLLFLNRSFWPDVEATGQNLTELCEDLSSEHRITFIAGPSVHVKTKHRGLWAKEHLGRIAIVRTWGTRLPKRRLIARLLNLGSYFVLAAIAALTTPKPDIVIAATDPPLLGALGALLSRLWRCPFVYNVRDLYPDVATANGGVNNRFLLGVLRWANQVAYTHAEVIIVLGEDMRRRVLGKGVHADKVLVVANNVDCSKMVPIENGVRRMPWKHKFVVMYSGNLGLSQQLESVIEAAARLRRNQRIHFVLIGEGVRKNWLRDQVFALHLENVEFHPYQPKERLAESLSAADIHLIPLLSAATGAIVPSKVYGILAVGRPFIAMMDDDTDIARMAREFSIGRVVKPGDVESLAEAIAWAADRPYALKRMGRAARRLAETRFDRAVIAREFSTAITMAQQQRLARTQSATIGS